MYFINILIFVSISILTLKSSKLKEKAGKAPAFSINYLRKFNFAIRAR